MVYNLFRFMSLFLLTSELQVKLEDLLLIKPEQLNLEYRELTIKDETFKLTEESTVSLMNLLYFLPDEHPFVFLSAN
ncbi:hypothetical protein [Metabacillus endolithicus]|uniref:Uncharacterized protein n=1 Tax=Metabacillus endolithicus TaxID=1535204 RepID=A0ABW5C1C1_9BACI|nr:hypothetical protein [Metabacillus endolithicus]UPG65542.1 hypothetical protein MVE64_11540 [Metabacillus endolithicus]